MTRRPPGRHRAPAPVWPVATAAAVLTAASLGVLAAPRDVAVQQPAADPPAVSDRASRAERPAPLLTGAGATTEAVALTVAALPTRACRCAPRQPVASVPTPTVQNTPQNATSAPLPRESPTNQPRTTTAPRTTQSEAPTTTAPSTVESPTGTTATAPTTTAAVTTAVITTESAPPTTADPLTTTTETGSE